jgi:hypothetical protein
MAITISGDSPNLTSAGLASPNITGTPVMGASVITSGTAVASTSGTSVDFTSIPSWVKRITIMFNGVSTNGTSSYMVQIGSGSFTVLGYLGQANSGAGITADTIGWIVNNNVGSASNHVGTVTISLLGSNTYIESGLVGPTSAVASMATSVGSLALGGVLDRVRITTFLGVDTFDAGSINILYE